jgi:hypothetical protein
MPSRRHARIVLELDLHEDDALIGTVALGDGDAEPFTGWIGLFAALEGSVDALREVGEGSPTSYTP